LFKTTSIYFKIILKTYLLYIYFYLSFFNQIYIYIFFVFISPYVH
jgi:hypothetical protein